MSYVFHLFIPFTYSFPIFIFLLLKKRLHASFTSSHDCTVR